jgi:hypothetical protein
MAGKWPIERIARTGLVAVVGFAVAAWILRRFLGTNGASSLNTFVVLLLLIAVPVGVFVARSPREISQTGDQPLDDEIDKLLHDRAEKAKKRS